MPRMAHPQTLQPSKPGSTRTAAAEMPTKFPTGGRYLSYMAFGATSFFYLIVALQVLRMVLALAAGPEAWDRVLVSFQHPLYLGFHAITLAVLLWAGWRFLIKLSAKAQPKKIGPLRPPPAEAIPPLMGVLWLGASALVIIVLWGVFP
jgi:fumarate reductase subunit C